MSAVSYGVFTVITVFIAFYPLAAREVELLSRGLGDVSV